MDHFRALKNTHLRVRTRSVTLRSTNELTHKIYGTPYLPLDMNIDPIVVARPPMSSWDRRNERPNPSTVRLLHVGQESATDV